RRRERRRSAGDRGVAEGRRRQGRERARLHRGGGEDQLPPVAHGAGEPPAQRLGAVAADSAGPRKRSEFRHGPEQERPTASPRLRFTRRMSLRRAGSLAGVLLGSLVLVAACSGKAPPETGDDDDGTADAAPGTPDGAPGQPDGAP